jgi:hypothetical protein
LEEGTLTKMKVEILLPLPEENFLSLIKSAGYSSLDQFVHVAVSRMARELAPPPPLDLSAPLATTPGFPPPTPRVRKRLASQVLESGL